MEKKYKSAKAFREALEGRLKKIVEKEGLDLNRARKQVAFDRFLARLFLKANIPWVLKGGYAMQLRLEEARGTRDIDLALKEAKFLSADQDERDTALLKLLQDQAALDLGDFFDFKVGTSNLDLENAPYGGSRFPVQARMDDRLFENFHIDIGIGDIWIEPLETLTTRPWLDFAGIEAQEFRAISKEQQFAEKIHAYTRPLGEGVLNSRVKDLIDMVLLIKDGSLDSKRLTKAIQATFDRRKTHSFSQDIDPPSEKWIQPYKVLAQECGIKKDLDAAYDLVKKFITALPPFTA